MKIMDASVENRIDFGLEGLSGEMTAREQPFKCATDMKRYVGATIPMPKNRK